MTGYQPINYKNVIGYDVIAGSFETVQRIARFAKRDDAVRFRDARNNDLRDGLQALYRRGDITREDMSDLLRAEGCGVVDAHDIPIVGAGVTLGSSHYNQDYGKAAIVAADMPTDASQE